MSEVKTERSRVNWVVLVAFAAIAVICGVVAPFSLVVMLPILIVFGLWTQAYSYAKRDSEGGWAIIAMVVLTVIVGVIAVYVVNASIVNVPAGYKGVITSSPNGADIGMQLDEGWHMNPYYMFCHIEAIRYNSQTEEFVGYDTSDDNAGSIAVRTSDNLEIMIDFSVTYHLPSDKVGNIRVTYGDFKHTILLQVCRSVPRDVASSYKALDIAGQNRSLLEYSMRTGITDKLANYSIIVDTFSLRDIRLPDSVDAAIQAKKAAEQNLITARYIADRQILLAEANRTMILIQSNASAQARIINANGSAEAIRLVMDIMHQQDPNNTNMTNAYLTWLYIQALSDPNSNVQYVVLGGKDGVPIIIDVGKP